MTSDEGLAFAILSRPIARDLFLWKKKSLTGFQQLQNLLTFHIFLYQMLYFLCDGEL